MRSQGWVLRTEGLGLEQLERWVNCNEEDSGGTGLRLGLGRKVTAVLWQS